jgi:hypothetical protein
LPDTGWTHSPRCRYATVDNAAEPLFGGSPRTWIRRSTCSNCQLACHSGGKGDAKWSVVCPFGPVPRYTTVI